MHRSTHRLATLVLLAAFGASSSLAQTRADLVPSPGQASWPDPVTLTPPRVTAGNTVRTPNWLITNRGTAAANGFSAGIYLSRDGESDVRLGGESGLSLAPGQQRLLTPLYLRVPASTRAGTWNVGVVVDEANAVPESNEGNNTMSLAAPLVVDAPVNVDLFPRAGAIAAGDPSATRSFGTRVEVAPNGIVFLPDLRVRNGGTEDSPPFNGAIFIAGDAAGTVNSSRVGFFQVPDLRRSSVQQVPQAVRLSLLDNNGNAVPPAAGDYFLRIVADSGNAVIEQAGGRKTNNAISTPVRILPGPREDTPVTRIQLRLRTATVKHAGTDDTVYVELNRDSVTAVDYGRNDFERGDSFLYDIPLKAVGSFGDVQYIRLNTGYDAWCVSGLELLLNGVPVFGRDFSPCRWVENTPVTVSYNDLRRHAQWAAFQERPLADRAFLAKADFESIIEATVGDAIDWTPLKWGRLHGRAVEVSRVSSTEISVDLDLATDILGWDMEVDIDFRLVAICGTQPRLEARNVTVSVDTGWVAELASLGFFTFVDWAVESLAMERIKKQVAAMGDALQPSLCVQFDSGANLIFNLPTGG